MTLVWTLVMVISAGTGAYSVVVPNLPTREACEALRADMSRLALRSPAFSRCVETAP